MRSAFALALCGALALSGCMGGSDEPSSDPGTDDGTTGDATTGEGTSGEGTTSPGVGNATQFKCTTTAGAAVLSGNGIGGCNLSNGISGEGTVTVLTPATGCRILIDVDGDAMFEAEAEVEETYEDGTAFGAFCDPTMPPNSESSMEIILV